MAIYQPSVRAPHERETVIDAAEGESSDTHTFYEYQNQQNELPVVRLEISLPIYRMSNFRTRGAQLKHIHAHDAADDFFSAGQENESAQDAQHKILVDFAKEGRSSSIVPIMDQLKEEEQREPLLITCGGVVVNGNRRLAAMRELFTGDPVRFSSFSHVDCAVLPGNVTPAEMLEIEVRLQMRAETKLPYGWIEESIAIREMVSAGRSHRDVAGLMKKKPKGVKTAERALTEVEIYLKDWERQPYRYELVQDAQQVFTDLAKAVDGVEGDMLEMKRRIAWALISADPKRLDGRLYGYNFSFEEKTDEVIGALSERLSIDLTGPASREDDGDDDGGLDIDLGEDEGDSGTSLQNLIDAFDDSDLARREALAGELIDVCDSIRELAKEENVGNQALNAISAAHRQLLNADLTSADPGTYDSIRAQLEGIRKRIEALDVTLARSSSPDSSPSEGSDA